MYKFPMAAVLICIFSLVAVTQDIQEKATKVSLVQLIATPDRFDGKLVIVQGFLVMGREGDLLFLGQSDADNGVLGNAIWVHRIEQMGRDKKLLDLKYVKVTGKFQSTFREQLGTPLGGIQEVKSVEFWSDPSHPLRQRIGEIPGVVK